MGWSDKSVSPCVYTPAAADASGWILEKGLWISGGKIEMVSPVTRGLLAAYRKGNVTTVDGAVAAWSDAYNLYHMTQDTASKRPPLNSSGTIDFKSLGKMLVVPGGLFDAADGDLSMVFRFKKTAAFASWSPWMTNWNNPYIGLTTGTNSGSWWWNNSGYFCNSGIDLAVGERQILAVSMRFGVRSAVWNSSAKATCSSFPLFQSVSYMTLGSIASNGAGTPGAEIEDVWIFNTFLTDAEVALFRSLP